MFQGNINILNKHCAFLYSEIVHIHNLNVSVGTQGHFLSYRSAILDKSFNLVY